MDLLSTILQLAPTLISDFGGKTSAPYLKQQKGIAANNAAIASELANPQSAGYQQIYNQYKDQNTQNLAQGIAELQGQNRLNAGMGRTPLFDQSRGGETLFRSLMQGYQGAGTQADAQTRQALTGALQAGGSAQEGYNSLSQYGGQANAQQLSGFDTLAKFLKGGQENSPLAGSGLSYNPTPPSMFNGENIKWNDPNKNQNQLEAGGGMNYQPQQDYMKGWTG